MLGCGEFSAPAVVSGSVVGLCRGDGVSDQVVLVAVEPAARLPLPVVGCGTPARSARLPPGDISQGPVADEHGAFNQDQEGGQRPPRDFHERAASGLRIRVIGDHGGCGIHPGKDTLLAVVASDRAEQGAAVSEEPETPIAFRLDPQTGIQHESVELGGRDDVPDDPALSITRPSGRTATFVHQPSTHITHAAAGRIAPPT